MWKKALKKSQWIHREVEPKRWNNFARRFNRGMHRDWVNKNSYVNQFLRRIKVDSSSTVLDIGCGPGTLTIPLAKKVKSVTALDVSSEMLNFVRRNAAGEGLFNIVYVNKSWEDFILDQDGNKHDVVIASRSLGGLDLKEKLLKMGSIAKRAVYLTWMTKVSDFEKEAYEAINRDFRQEPGYIYLYNMLYEQGIFANVDFIETESQEHFSDFDDAMEYYQWIMKDITKEEKEKLREYLSKTLVEVKGEGPIDPSYQKSKWMWALIWWRKENAEGYDDKFDLGGINYRLGNLRNAK